MKAPDTPEAAEAAGYLPVERWEIHEILHFIRRELATRTFWLNGHAVLLSALVAVGVYRGYVELTAGAAWFGDLVLPLGLGVALMAALIVPHELIHGVAYRLAGAPEVRYGADWRRLVFHASAPGFVVDYARMRLIALAPFVVLSSGLLAALLFAEGRWWWTALGLALIHTQGCLGDAAMLNAFARQEEPDAWVTYDDRDRAQFVFLRKQVPTTREGATGP